MIYEIMTVHDSAALAYLPPLHYQTIGVALRAFKDAANDPSHAFHTHPKDYTLFHLGTFDDQNSTFDLKTPSIALARAIDLIENPMSAQPTLFSEPVAPSGERKLNSLEEAQRQKQEEILAKEPIEASNSALNNSSLANEG